MILADTPVWIDHLRRADFKLVGLLNSQQILSHPFVVGEVALGSLRDAKQVIRELTRLPQAVMARDDEVMRMIDAHTLAGLGIGYIDAHLLASTQLTPGGQLWTRDKRLHAVATKLGLARS
jgi:predicted nucleic acid-binding protein